MEYKERIVYADLLRICAAAAVAVLHTAASRWYAAPAHTFNWEIMNVYGGLTRWAVPVLIMVSGALQFRPVSSFNAQQLSCKEEYRIIFKKRILRIIYALIFWSIVYNGYHLIVRHFVWREPVMFGDIAAIPLKIIFGPAWHHLWFLYIVIGLYLITPLVRIFIAHAQKGHIKSFLVLAGIIGSGVPFFNFIVSKIPALSAYRVYFPAPELSGYMGYYVAGYYFSTNDIRKHTRILFYLLALVSAVFTILGTSYWSAAGRPEDFLYGNILPTTMLLSFSIFLFFKKAFGAKRLDQKQIQTLCEVSRCTLGIYLFHDLVLQIFSLWGLTAVSFNPIIAIPLIGMVVFFISLIVISLIKKIPILEKYII
ncbi:MAG: acyltransferase family protein [Treponema sp.]|jgi:surface polysaccharide O-acyltransferase-like enzyme|nr:acyltransferase family protein [Treponema sp.]